MYTFGVKLIQFSDTRLSLQCKLTRVPQKMMQNFKVIPHQGLIATDFARKTIVRPVRYKVCIFVSKTKTSFFFGASHRGVRKTQVVMDIASKSRRLGA